MSNFDSDDKKQENVANNLGDKALPKKRWDSLKSDLSLAALEWDGLAEQPLTKSSDEEQLERVKLLIENLKGKLDGF